MEDLKAMRNSYGNSFAEYKGYRIFYDYKLETNRPWLITIYRGDPKPSSPDLGTYWFDDKDKGIQWAKDIIDARLRYLSNPDSSLKSLLLTAPQSSIQSSENPDFL
jgi:hypothetical protein